MRFVIIAPASAKSRDGVLPDDELAEATPDFVEAFAQAEALVAAGGLRPRPEGICSLWTAGKPTVMDGPMPCPALNAVFDLIFPKGIRSNRKGSFVTDLPDPATGQDVIHGAKVPEVSATTRLYPINGASHRAAADAAPAYREATFAQVTVAAWQDPATTRTASAGPRTTRPSRPTPSRAAASTSWPAMTAAGCETPSGARYLRLAEITRRYDLAGLFLPGPEHSALNPMAAIRTEVLQ